jgi:hypothetical protein
MLRACILFFSATLLGAPAMANVIGTDDRAPITEAYQRLGLDMVDMLRIRQTTGFVYCPGTVYGNPLRTSGAVVHDNQIVVTNAHSFVDEQGRRREPLSECYFKTQGIVPEVMRFDFSEGNFEIADKWMEHKMVNDYAVVRLKEPLKYARAFPLAAPEDFAEGRPFILVSGKPRRESNPFPIDEPIVQTCSVRKIFPPNVIHNTVFYGDCDISAGASGSVGLMLVSGRLHAFSTASGGGGPEIDGQPYNVNNGSSSFHTAFRDNVLAAILRLAK